MTEQQQAEPFATDPDVDDAILSVLSPYGIDDPAALTAVVSYIRRSNAVAWADGYRAGWTSVETDGLARNPYLQVDPFGSLRNMTCDHCRDDPPAGHTCPRCGRAAADVELVDP